MLTPITGEAVFVDQWVEQEAPLIKQPPALVEIFLPKNVNTKFLTSSDVWGDTATRSENLEIRVPDEIPEWVEELMLRLFPLIDLEQNWDSYGARPISLDLVPAVAKIFASIQGLMPHYPAMVPTTNGGLQLEWHEKGIDMEVEILPQGQISFFAEGIEPNEIEWVGEHRSDLNRLIVDIEKGIEKINRA